MWNIFVVANQLVIIFNFGKFTGDRGSLAKGQSQLLKNLLPYYNNTNSIYRAMIFSSSALI